nr:uncharacterized protein LOC127321357 [Lolium perenne]
MPVGPAAAAGSRPAVPPVASSAGKARQRSGIRVASESCGLHLPQPQVNARTAPRLRKPPRRSAPPRTSSPSALHRLPLASHHHSSRARIAQQPLAPLRLCPARTPALSSTPLRPSNPSTRGPPPIHPSARPPDLTCPAHARPRQLLTIARSSLQSRAHGQPRPSRSPLADPPRTRRPTILACSNSSRKSAPACTAPIQTKPRIAAPISPDPIPQLYSARFVPQFPPVFVLFITQIQIQKFCHFRYYRPYPAELPLLPKKNLQIGSATIVFLAATTTTQQTSRPTRSTSAASAPTTRPTSPRRPRSHGPAHPNRRCAPLARPRLARPPSFHLRSPRAASTQPHHARTPRSLPLANRHRTPCSPRSRANRPQQATSAAQRSYRAPHSRPSRRSARLDPHQQTPRAATSTRLARSTRAAHQPHPCFLALQLFLLEIQTTHELLNLCKQQQQATHAHAQDSLATIFVSAQPAGFPQIQCRKFRTGTSG